MLAGFDACRERFATLMLYWLLFARIQPQPAARLASMPESTTAIVGVCSDSACPVQSTAAPVDQPHFSLFETGRSNELASPVSFRTIDVTFLLIPSARICQPVSETFAPSIAVNWRLTCFASTLWPFCCASWNACFRKLAALSFRAPSRITSNDCVGFCCAALSSAPGMYARRCDDMFLISVV